MQPICALEKPEQGTDRPNWLHWCSQPPPPSRQSHVHPSWLRTPSVAENSQHCQDVENPFSRPSFAMA